MPSQPCGLKLGLRKAEIQLRLDNAATFPGGDAANVEVYLADAESGDVLFIHTRARLTSGGPTATIELQNSTTGNQIGYAANGAARIGVRFTTAGAPAQVAAVLKVFGSTTASFDSAEQLSDGTSDIFWTVTN